MSIYLSISDLAIFKFILRKSCTLLYTRDKEELKVEPITMHATYNTHCQLLEYRYADPTQYTGDHGAAILQNVDIQ